VAQPATAMHKVSARRFTYFGLGLEIGL
jgi:hypothetical protein